MEFTESKQQQMVRKLVRKFAETEIGPIAAELDEKAAFPVETINKAAKLGLLGMPFPKAYGGSGTDTISYAIAIEELSRVDGSHGVIVQTHCALCCWPILAYGTEEQKQAYLPDLLSGNHLGAFALTEPNAGTDASGMQTRATEHDDCWELNGTKIFISGADIAQVFVVFAITDKGMGTRGISAFIVERGDLGFSIGTNENKMGIRASHACELVFSRCRIPKNRMLGKRGKGFSMAMSALNFGRIGIACQALGIAQGAFDATAAYMQTRKQFGKPLSSFQALAFEMAEMKTRIDCARLLVYRAAAKRDLDQSFAVEAAEAKLYASETAMYVTTKAVQFHGGYGYIKDYPIERMMRDAKITEIYEGTSEVMKMVISSAIFK